MNDYDVVVVGGRVAGASTALLLARAGLRVAVVERSRLGADTVSTHALMRAGVLQLSRWGVLPELVAAGTPAIRRTAFHYADGEDARVTLRPTPGVDALYAPRRHLLDRVLVEAAATSGADVLHETPVVGLLRDDDGRVLGVRLPGTDGGEVAVRAGLTVGADGLGSLVAREVGAQVPDAGAGRPARCSTATSTRCRRTATSGPTAPGQQRGSSRPTPARRACSCATTPARMRTPPARRAPRLPSTACSTRSRPRCPTSYEPGGPSGRLHGWRGVPGQVRRSYGPGWALVGDAGYFKDPITTHGITDALRDAELLSDAVLEGLGGRVTGCRARPLRGHPRPTVESVVRGDGVRLPLRLGRRNRSGRCCDG